MDPSTRAVPVPGHKLGRILTLALLLAATALVGCVGEGGSFGLFTCNLTAERSASVPAEGIVTVRIVAESGSLDVAGQAGATDIVAAGTACASNATELEDMQFQVGTGGSEVVIEARTPSGASQFDVSITLPDTVAVEIDDGSGSVNVHGVAGMRINDGSGDVAVEGVGGDLEVIDDGSGSLDVSDIGGTVTIRSDGSGDINVAGVGGDLRIGSDSSGTIDVTDVGGDFSVGEDGSGGISYRNVAGNVDLPGS